MPTLERRLGLWSSVGIVVGITIGGGIFRTPAGIAARVPEPTFMLAVWVVGGLIALCGALAFADLSAAMPETGGLYVYLREGWGRPYAFLYGWAQLVLIRAAALGGISSVFGEYCLRSIGVDPITHARWADYLAAGAIVSAAAANIGGVQIAASIAGLSTLAKFGALSLLVVASLVLGGGHGASWQHLAPTGAAVDAGLFGLALISVLWAYDGFADLTFAAGEVKHPQKNLPRAILIGTAAIIAIYLAANVAYLYVIPISGVQSSRLVAADTMSVLFGRSGASFISVVVMISTFGSLMGSMLASPRIFFAMAEDGLFPHAIARVDPRTGAPGNAVALAAILGVVFVLVRTFNELAEQFIIGIWPFYALALAAVFVLRRRPGLVRAYSTWGYPWVPILFLIGSLFLLGNYLVSEPILFALDVAVILSGIPVYYAWQRWGTPGR